MAAITFQPSKYLLGLALCCTLSFDAFSAPQESKTPKKTEPRQEGLLVFRGIDPTAQQRWVDSVYKSLDLEGRVGQLIMPIIYPRPEDKSALQKRMKQEKWGGILFQKGLLADQRDLTQSLQEASAVPMLIALMVSGDSICVSRMHHAILVARDWESRGIWSSSKPTVRK